MFKSLAGSLARTYIPIYKIYSISSAKEHAAIEERAHNIPLPSI